MISFWPSVGGGSGPSPSLPVCTMIVLVLTIITQASFKVTVSWKNWHYRRCNRQSVTYISVSTYIWIHFCLELESVLSVCTCSQLAVSQAQANVVQSHRTAVPDVPAAADENQLDGRGKHRSDALLCNFSLQRQVCTLQIFVRNTEEKQEIASKNEDFHVACMQVVVLYSYYIILYYTKCYHHYLKWPNQNGFFFIIEYYTFSSFKYSFVFYIQCMTKNTHFLAVYNFFRVAK